MRDEVDAYLLYSSYLARDLAAVRWCLKRGASPDAASPIGYTAMQQAASTGSLEVMKELVAHGGTIAGTDLVAHLAFGLRQLTKTRLEVLRFLVNHGAPVDAYYMSRSQAWGASNNLVSLNYGRQNALHLSISEGNRDLVKVLLALGANPELEMFSLKTGLRQTRPRDLAQFLGRDDIAELL